MVASPTWAYTEGRPVSYMRDSPYVIDAWCVDELVTHWA
jgi:hypothetical protein